MSHSLLHPTIDAFLAIHQEVLAIAAGVLSRDEVTQKLRKLVK